MINEREVANEELRSANEEIQSSNEELQSTNEELETAKEELQSTNEELTTLNEELRHTNLELSEVNNDLLNLLRSVNIPIVIVGRDLRIRRFTPATQKTLKLIPSDVGRLITDLQPEDVLPKNSPVRNVEIWQDVPNIGRRKMLLNAARTAPPQQDSTILHPAVTDFQRARP